jgi:hydrogenase-4 component D
MLPSLRGIMQKTPLIGGCFAVAALAVTGVPPFNTFYSKFSIFAGGFQSALTNPWIYALVIIAILESIGSFAWIFWTFSTTVPGQPSDEVAAATPLAPAMTFVLVILAALTLVSGIFAASWIG